MNFTRSVMNHAHHGMPCSGKFEAKLNRSVIIHLVDCETRTWSILGLGLLNLVHYEVNEGTDNTQDVVFLSENLS